MTKTGSSSLWKTSRKAAQSLDLFFLPLSWGWEVLRRFGGTTLAGGRSVGKWQRSRPQGMKLGLGPAKGKVDLPKDCGILDLPSTWEHSRSQEVTHRITCGSIAVADAQARSLWLPLTGCC